MDTPNEKRSPTRLERAIAADAIAPPARPAFRDALRERFVVVPAEKVVTPAPRAPRRAGGSGAPPTGPRATSLPRWLLPVAGVAAAAVLLFALLPRDVPEEGGDAVADAEPAGAADAGPTAASGASGAWHLVDYRGAGSVLVDGAALDGRDTARLDEALAEAERLETFQGHLELAFGKRFVMELQPDTLVRADRPTADTARLFVERGELYLTTLDGHRGRIEMATPDVEVLVTGTTLGVLSMGEQGSCVCVVEGEVVVTAGGVDTKVGSRTTHRVERDGTCDTHAFPDLAGTGHEHERRLDAFYRRR